MRLVRDETGTTILAVVGLIAIAAIMAVTITATTIHALGFTSATRAGVQAQAAADAGVEFARALIENDDCPATGKLSRTYGEIDPDASSDVAENLYFEATIQYGIVLSGSWTTGCPTGLLSPLLNYQVRIESTGHAESPGVNGISALDDATVEAVYGWSILAAPAGPHIDPSGAAVYNYAASSTIYSGLTVTQESTEAPGVQFKTGNFSCTNNTRINGTVVAGSGSATIDSGCRITGNLYASSAVTMISNGIVDGSVYAAGVVNGKSFVQTNSTNRVGGSLYAAGPVDFQGVVDGNVLSGPTAGTVPSKLYARSSVGGNFTTAGSLTVDGGISGCSNPCTSASAALAVKKKPHVVGVVQYGASGVAAPVIPAVPNWVDFSFKASDWEDESGNPFAVVTLSPLLTSDCSWDWSGSTGIAKLKLALASTRPTIIDARACGTLNMYASVNPKLTSDLVIIATGFAGGSNTWASATSAQRRLWIVTPDDVPDQQPSCGGLLGLGNKQGFTFNSGFVISDTISATAYSPCVIENSSTTWRGQFYAKSVVMHGGITLKYLPNGLPNVNLTEGTNGSGGILDPILNIGSLGELDYYRDLPESTVD